MSDADKLLRAISLHPEDDTPRLMFADEIAESDPARAEFIKAQCLVARINKIDPRKEPISVEDWDTFNRCKKLQAELLNHHEAEWRRPKCPECGGDKEVPSYTGMYRLGSKTCPTCRGTGACGPLSERINVDKVNGGWKHAVTWHRGFPVVKCKLEEVWRVVGMTTGRDDIEYVYGITPWAVECVRTTGATFEVSDVNPNDETYPFRACWYFNDGTARDYSHWLPMALLEPMRELYPNIEYTGIGGMGRICLADFKGDACRMQALTACNAALHRLVVRAAYSE